MRLDELPEQVRARVITLAAAALGAAPAAQVPAGLVAVARFAPAKRASRGAVPLAKAVDTDAAFRALVAQLARTAHRDVGGTIVTPDGVENPSGPDLPAPDDPNPVADGNDGDDVSAVTLAYLSGKPVPQAALLRITEAADLAGARRRIQELEKEVGRLTTALGVVGEQQASAARRSADEAGAAEAERLRGRLREQGSRVRRAEQSAEQVQAAATREIATLTARLSVAEQARKAAEARATKATAEADRVIRTLAAHQDSGEREVGARDRRIELLLDSISAAAEGLRREWDLVSGGELPADLVAGQVARTPVRPRSVSDPARLADLLSVPGAHLIVDGYNVTKTGYPDLTLADQRDRLIRSLSTLTARTSAEITVVFDGAAVTTPPPAGRKVRVLFSPPGVIADDVIRRLVAAEPVGRLVAVATSDRAVVTDVGRAGARTVGSDVLLGLLGRGG